jgi:carbon storage regulator CsrA
MTQIWRQANEQVLIGDDVTVTVLAVGVSFVRLAIECPRFEPSYREGELAKNLDDSGAPCEVELTTGKRLRV